MAFAVRLSVFLLVLASGLSQAQRLPTPNPPPADARRIPSPFSDWAGLTFYADDNAKLPAPKPGDPPRVVFLGDSITRNWGIKGAYSYTEFFQRHPNYINRGIGGQNTAQMLPRYRQDVLALQPKVVVLLAGTNDFEIFIVPDLVTFIEQNIASMVELAELHHERIILCSILPVSDVYKPVTTLREPAKIMAVNAWLKQYASEQNISYVDFYSVLSDGSDRIQTKLTFDGLHPNQAGYKLMEPLVEAAIAKELAR